DLIYAVNVLDAVGEGLDRLAAQSKLAPQLAIELMKNSPDIFDSLLAICQPEFRIVLYDLGRKAINAVKMCQPKKRK
ncbi:unnamed protein product, partial [marine sediment metagenome]